VGEAPDQFVGAGTRLLPAARVFLSLLVIAVVTALLTVVKGLNGYCGDSGPSRLMAYAGGASAISWLLAFSWTAYYYDRHL
jgi:hypothetical protein